MNQEESNQNDLSGVNVWDIQKYLTKIEPLQAMLSRGFLRSKPEGWFPGLSSQWIVLAHSLTCDIKCLEVKPVVGIPNDNYVGFGGEIDNEPFGVLIDRNSANVIIDAVSSESGPNPGEVILEYIIRRLVGSLAISWSGGESTFVNYNVAVNPFQIPIYGSVKLVLLINGYQSTIWFCLGQHIIQRLDGLWRRQVHSSSRNTQTMQNNPIHFEIAQLAVPPSMLSEYLKPGTIIDLEVPMTDTVTVRLGSKPLFPSRLCEVEGKFAFETLSVPVTNSTLPEGTTRVTIELGHTEINNFFLAEISQPGAILISEFPLNDKVQMLINNEIIGAAYLRSFEGRFAIQVM